MSTIASADELARAAAASHAANAAGEELLCTASASCLYEGSVRHRRHGTPSDEFHHRLSMLYLDLDELPELFDDRLLWSARRPAPLWFRRADYLGDPEQPLSESVKRLVLERTGIVIDGPIRLLTHVRCLGHCFNPVSFYYCHNARERIRAVVAEVTNTPWGERHAYVLAVPERPSDVPGGSRVMRGQFAKALHVSPLMGMEHSYDWRLSEPGERLSVHIESSNSEGGELVFDATLSLARRELNARELRRVLLRYPLPTLRLTTRIYTHALGLRLRGASWHPHPGKHDKAKARA